jgi:hypothetical protein
MRSKDVETWILLSEIIKFQLVAHFLETSTELKMKSQKKMPTCWIRKEENTIFFKV